MPRVHGTYPLFQDGFPALFYPVLFQWEKLPRSSKLFRPIRFTDSGQPVRIQQLPSQYVDETFENPIAHPMSLRRRELFFQNIAPEFVHF